MTAEEFDYVIVGGGTAGCIVAARLSEDPSVRVCLLEAGPSDVGDDAILILNRWMQLLDSGYDWDYPIEPQERGNSFLRHARAKVLGGCSSHNSCIAFWPPAEGLDEWVAMGATGWDAASTLPYVTKLEDSDLLAASTRRGFVLRRSIALSATAEDLVRASSGITDLVVDLVRGGTDAIATSGILSVVIDSVARRALELSLGEVDDLPPARFAWITLGSIARRETMPSSDLDTAMSWPDDAEPDARRYLGIARRAHAILDACALPADRNGALASSRRFARSSSAWLRATQQWMAAPLEDQGLVMSSLLVDGRVIWGDPALHTVPVGYRRMRLDHPEALRLQLLDALSTRVWQRSFWNVLSRRAGTLDLKAHAVTPVVNLARWGGLSVGMASATTPARLIGAASNDSSPSGTPACWRRSS